MMVCSFTVDVSCFLIGTVAGVMSSCADQVSWAFCQAPDVLEIMATSSELASLTLQGVDFTVEITDVAAHLVTKRRIFMQGRSLYREDPRTPNPIIGCTSTPKNPRGMIGILTHRMFCFPPTRLRGFRLIVFQ